MARVNINRTKSRAYARDWAEEKYVEPLSRRVLIDAKALAQVKTGYMRSQLRVTKRRFPLELIHRVGTPAPYAVFPHSGTRPHPIVPRRLNGRLVFFWAKVGRRVSLEMVNHPGSKGSRFLTGPLFAHGIPMGFRVVIRTGYTGGLI